MLRGQIFLGCQDGVRALWENEDPLWQDGILVIIVIVKNENIIGAKPFSTKFIK